MQVENAFEVAQDRTAVWDLLMDVPRVVPCVPGATLLETLGDERWKAELAVRLGPMSMTFASDVRRAEVDPVAGTVLLEVTAREKSGRGGAAAQIRSSVTGVDGGTRVTVTSTMRLQGAVARVGRSDIVEDVSQQMIDAFAGCLQSKLTGELAADEAVAAPGALRLLAKSLWARLRRAFRRGR